MLFKNLKSGNFIEATNEMTIDLMRSSPCYEEVTKTETVAAPSIMSEKKTGKKSGATKPTE